MIQETSRAAFKETNLTREAMCKQLQALYEKGNWTDREVVRKLGWNPSDVSARRNDLGSCIQSKFKRKDEYTGRAGIVWGLWDRLF